MKRTHSVDVPHSYPSELRYEPRMICGFRPVPEPHLGIYIGVLQHMVLEQNRHPGSSYCLIADWHAATMWLGRPHMQQATLATAAMLLAIGVDPRKTLLFAQSHVTGLGEMSWLLSCMTPESLLLRNPVPRNTGESRVNIGAVLYPVLMSADVLALRGTKIVVGRDQVMNARKVRQIARAGNRIMGREVFPVPGVVVRGESVPGIDGTKMDFHRGNHVPIFCGVHELRERIQQIQTDSRRMHDQKDPETCTVFRLYALVASPSRVEEMRARYCHGQIGYEEAKNELAIAIVERFSGAMEKFQEWCRHPDDIRDVLRNGAQVASAEVGGTLAVVREHLGLAL